VKKLLLVFMLIASTMLMPGCFSSLFGTGYNYSARAENIGKTSIYLEPVKLFDSENSFCEMPVGILTSGSGKEAGQYYHAPDKSVELTWKNIGGDEQSKVTAEINPPENFRRGTIVFRINPEKKTVCVSYVIFNPDTGDRYEVDSEGKPIEHPKSAKKPKTPKKD